MPELSWFKVPTKPPGNTQFAGAWAVPQTGVLCVWLTGPAVVFAIALCVLVCVNAALLIPDEGHDSGAQSCI